MKHTQHCYGTDELVLFLQDDCPASQAAEIDQHIAGCAACQASLKQAAGDEAWWVEAGAMLSDFDQADLLNDDGLADSPSPKERLEQAGLSEHLLKWLAPTDDPTKMGRVGAFEVVGVLGHGGAGVVLKAHDPRLNRFVALKVLLPALAHNTAARKRFERESRAVAAITHQNVVPIHTVDTHNGHPYLAMQYVAGESLQQRLNTTGPMPLEAVVRIAAQVARALAAAHAQGVIHRDIKPANILLESNIDRAMVTDFGLARVIDEASVHTGTVTGTPQYMSPEQCRGEAADHRSDLFSLGSVMYAMCVGRSPFRAETLVGLLGKVCEHQPRSVRELNAQVPEWLDALTFRLLEKGVDDRFDTAGGVADVLEAELAYLQNPTAVALPVRDWIKTKPASKRVFQKTDSRFFNQIFTNKRILLMLATAIPFVTLLSAVFLLAALPDKGAEHTAADAPPQSIAQAGLAVQAAIPGAPLVPGSVTTRPVANPVSEQVPAPAKRVRGNVDPFADPDPQPRSAVVRRPVTMAAPWQIPLVDSANHHVIKQTFPVTKGGKLKLEVADGNVYVMGGHDDDAKGALVKIHQVVTNATDAQDAALALARHQHEERFDKESNTLTIQSKVTRKDPAESKRANVQVYYEIRVPHKFELDLALVDGDAAAFDIKGGVKIVSVDGSITVREIKGSLEARTQDGDMVVESIKGGVKAASQDGDLVLSTIMGGTEAQTQDGDLVLSTIMGAIKAKTQDGDIVFNADQPVTGDIELVTIEGDIVANLGGSVAARINASATEGEVLAQVNGLMIKQQSASKLKAQVGEAPRFTIEAGTEEGDIVIGTHKE